MSTTAPTICTALDPVPMSQVLISDPRIRKLTFTGSTDVGRLLYSQAAQTLKRVSLELGGNAPFQPQQIVINGSADAPAGADQGRRERNAGRLVLGRRAGRATAGCDRRA